MVDGREGRVAGDDVIARETRAAGVPVIVAINKTDDQQARDGAIESYQLGFDPVVEISAEHGQGVGNLLDEIVKRLHGRARHRRKRDRERGASSIRMGRTHAVGI